MFYVAKYPELTVLGKEKNTIGSPIHAHEEMQDKQNK